MKKQIVSMFNSVSSLQKNNYCCRLCLLLISVMLMKICSVNQKSYLLVVSSVEDFASKGIAANLNDSFVFDLSSTIKQLDVKQKFLVDLDRGDIRYHFSI